MYISYQSFKQANIQIWEEATSELPLNKSFDKAIVSPTSTGFITAVVDAAVNTTIKNFEQRNRDGLEDFSHLLRTHKPVKAAQLWAQKHRTDTEVLNHNVMLATSIAIYNSINQTYEFYRAGDCEVWVYQNHQWVNIFPEDMLTVKGRTGLDNEISKQGSFNWGIQEQHLGTEDCWSTPPVGLTPKPSFVNKIIPAAGVQKIVLSSDGARLNEVKLNHLPAWLHTDEGVHRKRDNKKCNHGDISVIQITPKKV